MTETTCFHCGLPVPAGAKFSATIGGQSRAMCCPGCQAVASAIAAGGLDRFYRYRSELSQRPDPERQSAFAAYDLPEVADPLVEKLPNGHRRVRLLVGGINCAACSWLIENYFSTVSFVDSVSVNVSAHRAEVEWNPAAGKLSELLQSFLEIGYDALPLGDESAQIVRQRENRSALMRLGVAGIGMMQAGMLAVSLYAGALQGIEPAMESFLRWVSLIIATPVVFYSGNPFFRAAWRNIRVFGLAVRQLTMDVPVSIALLLAWSASAWATVSRSGEVYFDSGAISKCAFDTEMSNWAKGWPNCCRR
ncbi:MAG: heavy metal translocating P-type ATPase metal-binding domain-containing protein [bacterium]